MTDKVEKHEKEINSINNRLTSIERLRKEDRRHFDAKFDDIREAMRPQFTKGQVTTMLIFILSSLVGIMLYTTDTRSNTRDNATRLESMEGIYKDISQIKQDIAYIKGKEDARQ